MLTPFLLSQILVFFALLADIASFQCKERKNILLFFTISATLLACHYFLLDRYTAFLLVFMSAIRYAIAYFSTRKEWMYLFIAISTVATIILYKDFLDIIMYIANVIGSIVAFQKSDKSLRLLAMSWTSLVIVYNILVKTPMGVLIETIFLLSNFVGYYRYYLRKK